MSATVDKVSAVEAINMDMEYIAVLMKAVIESAEQREAVRKLNENLAEDFMVLLMTVSLIY
jgi:hypothetical protein